jgi:hypothetical protein
VIVHGTSLTGVLVEGLTATVTDVEREAARRPPYPVPAAQHPPRDRLLRELVSRLPAAGDGPPTVTRVKGRPVSYRREVDSLGRAGGFNFADAACALLAVGALDDADVEALIEFLPAYCGIRRQQVLNRLALADVAGARAAAIRIGDGLSWVGYRDIGAALADQGDTEGFFADWKGYAAARDRAGMAELRRRLVIGVARSRGWQAALVVTEDKRIGPGFAKYAFTDLSVGDVERVFAGAAAGVLSEMDELSVLAQAVRAAAGHNPERDHPLLNGIVDRIIAVDPTSDKATMRWRDAELYALWPAYGAQATLDRVRAAVRTPRYRRDLRVLARDLDRSKNTR